jgi:hypothetical protein
MALFELDTPLRDISTETLYEESIQWIQDILGKRSFLTVDNFRDMERIIHPSHMRLCLYLGEMYRRGISIDLPSILDTTSITCLVCKDLGEVTDMSNFKLKGVCPVSHNHEESDCRVLCTKCMKLGQENMRTLTEPMRLRLLAGKYNTMISSLWRILPILREKLDMIQFVKRDMIQRKNACFDRSKQIETLMDQIADLPGFKPTQYKQYLTPDQWRGVRIGDLTGLDLDELMSSLLKMI